MADSIPSHDSGHFDLVLMQSQSKDKDNQKC